jgi:glycogen debranching enzyme
LANQGWKDSWDGVSSADGRLGRSPIVPAEVEGCAYAAWLADRGWLAMAGPSMTVSSAIVSESASPA